jgi:hypothetical protein
MRGSYIHKPRVVLASRKNAGIRVKLLWAADTNTVTVLVRGDSTNEQFELLVEPDANPIDVHEHLDAYAAWRGIRLPDRGPAAGGLKQARQRKTWTEPRSPPRRPVTSRSSTSSAR